MNSFIRLLYALLIAISVAVFIGFGVVSFYAPPKSPEYPQPTYVGEGQPDKNYQVIEAKYQEDNKIYKTKQAKYQRNVTYIVLPLAVIILAAGLYLMRKPGVIGEGLALGGILTSAYGIITASMAESNSLRFVAVTLLLIGAMAVGHLRFGNGSNFGNGHAKSRAKSSSK